MVSGAPDCPDVLFVGFRTDFVSSVRVSVGFRRSFGPRGPSARMGPKIPRGAHTLPLGYVPATGLGHSEAPH